jgi:hypothetical protein
MEDGRNHLVFEGRDAAIAEDAEFRLRLELVSS